MSALSTHLSTTIASFIHDIHVRLNENEISMLPTGRKKTTLPFSGVKNPWALPQAVSTTIEAPCIQVRFFSFGPRNVLRLSADNFSETRFLNVLLAAVPVPWTEGTMPLKTGCSVLPQLGWFDTSACGQYSQRLDQPFPSSNLIKLSMRSSMFHKQPKLSSDTRLLKKICTCQSEYHVN